MKQIDEYKTVQELTPAALDTSVNAMLAQGFQPLGTPYVAHIAEFCHFFQAMVKWHPDTAAER